MKRKLFANIRKLFYLKFYPENKVGLFLMHPIDTLNLKRYPFNPQNAKMGYYYTEGDKIYMKISHITQCALTVSQTHGKITNDTLREEYENHGQIYIRKNIPTELIEKWKPDW